MKLTFKDLKQQKFVIEAEPSETIGAVKDKIAAEKGWDASQQKLIYSGKILQDANTVESYKIEEKGFIVCMIQKPKPTPAAANVSSSASSAPVNPPSTPAPAVSNTPAAPQAPVPASSNTTAAPPSTPSPASGGAPAQPGSYTDPSTLALGAQRNAAIADLESMGFERTQIDRAMRAAFNNPERAVEYLLTRIPENLDREPAQAAAPTPGQTRRPAADAAPAAQQPSSGAAATTGEAGDEDAPINLFEAAEQARGGAGRGGGAARGASGGNAGATEGAQGGLGQGAAGATSLDFLRDNPQFQQLRQIVQTQPRMLEPILQQVGAGNPQLAQLIGQNPDQFLQLLTEPVDDDMPLPPGAHQISITPEQQAAIERLCNLGFDRDLVIQAYFACDENEDLAANFLFDQPPDEDEGGQGA